MPILRDAVRVLRASGVEFNASYAEMLLARASLALGDLEEAEAEIAPLVDRFTEMGTRLTAFEATLVRAEIAVERGRAGAGTGAPRRGRGGSEGGGRAAARPAVPPAGRGAAGAGRPGRLLDGLVDEGLATAREQDLPYEEALLLRVASRLAEACAAMRDAAADLTADADRLLARLGVRGADRQALV